MAGLYRDDFIETLRRGAAGIVSEWGVSPRTTVTLVTVSENATFRADDPDRDAPLILRVQRPGYHDRAEVEAELAWIEALRRDRVTPIAVPIRRCDGGLVGRFETADGPRDVVAFTWLAGRAPDPAEDLTAPFRDLGAITARLHDHARRWRRPAGFRRKTWTAETTIGPRAHWGDWRAAPGLTAESRALLDRAADRLRRRLAAFGAGADRFGLIHADLRLANLLIDAGRIAVIDFDDCGFSWFAFDFAAAISFHEADPQIPALQAAWLEGYRAVAPLDAETEAMLPDFVMLRRMQLTAWLATHAETPTAQALTPGWAADTAMLAARYLGA